MVVYTLLKKHAFVVLKCQKNGPLDQSEMTQDQLWPQGAHICLTALQNMVSELATTVATLSKNNCRGDEQRSHTDAGGGGICPL